MIDRFQYNIGVPAEALEQYRPGGYHPIHLNDLLNDGQYEILHKLGFGSFATVWLARDHQQAEPFLLRRVLSHLSVRNQRNVSIKVIVASKSESHNQEFQILQSIRKIGNPYHPGRKHVSQLLDWFYQDRPNGRHLCVVLELLGPKVSAVADRCQNYRLDGNLARRVSRQLRYATNYLHSCGVAHGDIHMGNVLFRLPGLFSQRAIEEFGIPQRGKVSRKDGAPLEKGLPEYLVEPFEYEAKDSTFLDEVQLVDFGESFFISNAPKLIYTSLSLHPPELVFQQILTEAVDIWNLGSTTYELVTGRTPYEAFVDEKELIPQFQQGIGGVPEKWVQDALSSGMLKERIDDSTAKSFLSLEQRIRNLCQLGEGEVELLIR